MTSPLEITRLTQSSEADQMTRPVAYKVLTADEWAALSSNAFQGSPIDQSDGFVHLSTAGQLNETVNRHFREQAGLVVASIDLVALGDSVRWEPSRDGELFPHVYAQLESRYVIAFGPLQRDDAGAVRLPTARCDVPGNG